MSFRKDSVRAVVTGNVATLSGLSPADSDGVTLVADDRILLIAQTDPVENGLWEVAAGAWARPTDSDTEVPTRSLVAVEEGAKYKSAGFVLRTLGTGTDDAVIVDTDDQAWVCFTQTGMAPGWINVQDFGAVGDATTNNSVAFASALDGFPGTYYPPPHTQVDGTLYVPPGEYKMESDLWISRGVRLLGAAGSGDYTSKLQFASYKGIFIVQAASAPDYNDAGGTIIEALLISGGHKPGEDNCAFLHNKWTEETEYDPEDPDPNKRLIVQAMPRDWDDDERKYQSTDRYYECIVAGTSGATEPFWETSDYAVDAIPGMSEWAASTPYNTNAAVWVAGHYDKFFVPDPTAPIFNQLSGTNSAALTALDIGNTGSDGGITWLACDAKHYLRGDTINDPADAILADQPVWVARRNAGIRVFRRCKIVDCMIQNFLNAGIEISCDALSPISTVANGTQVMNVQIRQCGGGIHTQFSDAGACLFQGVDIQGCVNVASQMEPPADATREFGIYDRAKYNSTYIATQIAEVGGPHIFQTHALSTPVYICPYTEGNCGPAIFNGPLATVIGGNVFPLHDKSIVNGILSPGDWRGVGSRIVLPQSVGAETSLLLTDTGGGVYTMGANDGSGVVGWIYNKEIAENVGDGTWTLLGNNDPTKVALRLTTFRSRSKSAFMPALPRGFFTGEDDTHELLFTPGGATAYDVGIRGGRRLVGDRNADKTLIKPHSFFETVVIEDGFRGEPAWPAHLPVNSFSRGISYLGNDACFESGGYVYRCCDSGTTDTTAPTPLPTTISEYPDIQIWNGAYFNVGGGQTVYRLGDYVRPRTANGYIYKCVDAPVGPGGVHEGKVGIAEPLAWATTLTDTTFDGDLTWECYATDDNSSFFDADGTASWVCIGKLPTYGKTSFIHNTGTLALGTDTVPVSGTIDLGPLRDNEINIYRVTVRGQNVNAGKYAYFELTAAWDAENNELEAPDVAHSYISPLLSDWDAYLQLNGDRVEVFVQHDGGHDVTFTAIRAIS